MDWKVYSYAKCGSCKKALKFLDEEGIAYKLIPIVDKPPSKSELKRMLKYVDGNIRKLFNTSGQLYRSMKLSDKLKDMSQEEAIDLLSGEGMLVKRPFVLGTDIGFVGFQESAWKEKLI